MCVSDFVQNKYTIKQRRNVMETESGVMFSVSWYQIYVPMMVGSTVETQVLIGQGPRSSLHSPLLEQNILLTLLYT